MNQLSSIIEQNRIDFESSDTEESTTATTTTKPITDSIPVVNKTTTENLTFSLSDSCSVEQPSINNENRISQQQTNILIEPSIVQSKPKSSEEKSTEIKKIDYEGKLLLFFERNKIS